MKDILIVALMFALFAIVYGLTTAEQRSKQSAPAILYIGLLIALVAGSLLLAGSI